MIFIILAILVACIILNSYLMRKEAARREDKHERRQERFERLMNMLHKPNSNKNDSPDISRENETNENEKTR